MLSQSLARITHTTRVNLLKQMGLNLQRNGVVEKLRKMASGAGLTKMVIIGCQLILEMPMVGLIGMYRNLVVAILMFSQAGRLDKV